MSIELLNKCYELDVVLKEKQKLQSNWNSLREWLDRQREGYQHAWIDMSVILDKMNKLEGVNNE